MNDDGAMKPFNDETEKFRFLVTAQQIRLETPLPCNGPGCLNMSRLAIASYDMEEQVWNVVPLCHSHIHEMARMFGLIIVEPEPKKE